MFICQLFATTNHHATRCPCICSPPHHTTTTLLAVHACSQVLAQKEIAKEAQSTCKKQEASIARLDDEVKVTNLPIPWIAVEFAGDGQRRLNAFVAVGKQCVHHCARDVLLSTGSA